MFLCLGPCLGPSRHATQSAFATESLPSLHSTATISPVLRETLGRQPFVERLRPIRDAFDRRYHKWLLGRDIDSMPWNAVVPIDKTSDVLLLCSRLVRRFDAKVYLQELAFAHELAARNRTFAISVDPSLLVDKSVIWFLPNHLVSPRLWDHSRQVYEFAAGLERQGNKLLCSSDELMYWENKATMHRRLRDIALRTPETKILSAQNWESVAFDMEPVLLKKEHSAGSAGIYYFPTAIAARTFAMNYPFRAGESLIMQEVVSGATKDLRLTMVGNQMIRSATFWRRKSPEALSSGRWTTTASKHGSSIEHENIPEQVVPTMAGYLRRLGMRMAGIDLIWVDDDVSRTPLVLEVSPYFQPNPPKPHRYTQWSYKQYKERPYAKEGYLLQQYSVFREMAAQVLDQKLY
jgi:glutathione synthase/RimK-type ligase-like ATP-grasp enzyme